MATARRAQDCRLGALLTGLMLLAFPSKGAVQISNVMLPDAIATKREILKQVPLGTPIEDAKTFMEKNGFKCEMIKNQGFSEDVLTPGKQISHDPTDFLSCYSRGHSFRLVLTRQWQVVFVDVNGKVSYVAVAVGVTGL